MYKKQCKDRHQDHMIPGWLHNQLSKAWRVCHSLQPPRNWNCFIITGALISIPQALSTEQRCIKSICCRIPRNVKTTIQLRRLNITSYQP